jgi:hypothetical protein
MRLEKPLRKSKSRRHRFIRLIYQAACDPTVEYTTIVTWLKNNYKVCVTVAEVRQLVLYSGLFGSTDSMSPPISVVRYVLKHCVMSVPRLHMFKKWCVDVKRLESSPDNKDRSKGYFAPGSRDDDSCTIQSLIQDFQSYENMDGSDNGGEDEHSVESEHEESVKSPGDKFRSAIRQVMAMNLFGGLAENLKKKELLKQYGHERKRGAANLYSLSADSPEFNKFIAELDKGNVNAKVSLTKEMDERDINFNQRMRCTDTMLVKKVMSTAPVSTSDKESMGVDVDIIMDIINELHEAEINSGNGVKSSGKRASIVMPRMKQSLAMMTFKQQSKASKRTTPTTDLLSATNNSRDMHDEHGEIAMTLHPSFQN